MHRVEDTVWELLYPKVKNSTGDVVPVLINSPPEHEYNTCITLETVGTTNRSERFIENTNILLPESHPLYHPTKKYPVDVTYQRRGMSVNIHIWAYNEEDRHSIIEQVLTLLNQALNYHHIHCKNYDIETGECENLKVECKALQNIYSRGEKGQCPKPDEYGYINLLSDSLIIPYTVNIGVQHNTDDLNTNPVTLHTIINLELDYYHTYIVGGTPTLTYQLKEEEQE